MKPGARTRGVVVSSLMLVPGPPAPLAPPQPPPPAEPATQQPAPQPAASMAEPMPLNPRGSDSVAYNVGAGIANVFYVPGKAILCSLGAAGGIFVMIISVGSQPRTAAFFAREGCGGRWYVTGDDLRPEADVRDRKSTRLNSSHPVISYAVFCLKKKKTKRIC